MEELVEYEQRATQCVWSPKNKYESLKPRS